ncbi:Bdr family repetitive protein [Borreliella garinii]|uniref:Bdr family repetitive protein n=1 Tax=Borreliella garinii TaxID=29519 RepID=UPI00292FAED2|nr:Bdr family repetitive protein [Borreliella garinii]WNZ74087.1 Bdr family repetitive protein [Borreliella garinii]WNZ75058.1 Bdr family repetitive protein [Borreliella garinii]
MNNLAYRTYNIESIKNEFLNIGFSEEAIDFVFLHNDNYNFEFLKEKIIDAERNLRKDISNLDAKIDVVEKSLNTKIDAIEKSLQKDISSLDTKIDNVEKALNVKLDFVEKNLTIKIDSLGTKIDSVKSELTNKIKNEVKDLRKDLNTGNRLIHFMILIAAIFGPIFHALFTKYL